MTRTRLRTSLLLASVAGGALLASQAMAQTQPALPTGGVVVNRTSDGQGAFIVSSGPTMTIDQSSRRVVIDWQSFNVGQGGTVRFNQGGTNFIAVNRVNPQAGLTSINGAISAIGSVWLFAPGGLLFGPNAMVNVGSLVASTGAGFSDSNSLNSNFVSTQDTSNNGRAPIIVEAGARLTTNAGFAAFLGEDQTINGEVTASGDVLYLNAAHTAFGFTDTQGLSVSPTSIGFAAPAGQENRPRFNHAGTTTAGGFVQIQQSFLPQNAPGHLSVINISGIVEAQGIRADGGYSVLISGPENGPSGVAIDLAGSRITGPGNVFVAGASTRLGAITARDLLARAGEGDFSFAGDIDVAESISVNAPGSVRLDPGVTIRADSDGNGAGSVLLRAGRDISAGAGSLIAAGLLESAPTGSITLQAGRNPLAPGQLGGDLTVNGVVGKSVSLTAESGSQGVGALTVNGSVFGADSVSLNSLGAAAPRGGDIRVLGSLLSNGSVTVTNNNDGSIIVGSGVTVQSDRDGNGQGNVDLRAHRSVLAAPTSILHGGVSPNAPTADVFVVAGNGPSGTRVGGDVTLGAVYGRIVDARAISGTAAAGNITANGLVIGLNSALIGSYADGVGNGRAGNVDIRGAVRSNGGVTVQNHNGGDVLIGAGATIFSDQDNNGQGDLLLSAENDVIADATSTLLAGGSIANPTARVQVNAGFTILTGGNIDLGRVSGRTVGVFASAGSGGNGRIRLLGDILGSDDVNVGSNRLGQSPRTGVSRVEVLGNISSNGNVSLYSQGAIEIGANRTLRSDADGSGVGTLRVDADTDITVGTGTLLVAGPIQGAPTANVTLDSGVRHTNPDGSFDTFGGDMILRGSIRGRTVDVFGNSSATAGGSVLLEGDIVALDLVRFGTSAWQGRRGSAVTINGSITTNGQINVYNVDGGNTVLGATGRLQGDADGDGVGGVGLGAERNVTTAQGSLVLAGGSAVAPTGFVGISAGNNGNAQNTATRVGGDLNLAGSVIGRQVNLTALSAAGNAADIVVGGTVFGRDSVLVRTGALLQGGDGRQGGGIRVTGQITSNGRVDVQSYDGGDIEVASTAVLRGDADGDMTSGTALFLDANRNISVLAGSLLATGLADRPGTGGVSIFAGYKPPDIAAYGGDMILAGTITSGAFAAGAAKSSTRGGLLTISGDVTASGRMDVDTVSPDRIPGSVLNVTGRLRSNGRMEVLSSGDLLIGPNSLIQSDLDGSGDGDMFLYAVRDVTTGAGSTVMAGAAADRLTAIVTMESGTNNVTGFPQVVTTGGALTTGGTVSGRVVNLQANSGGNVSVGAPVLGAESVRIRTTALGELRGGTISVRAGVASNGGVTLENLAGGDINIGAVTMRSDADGNGQGELTIRADRDVVADRASLLTAGPATGPRTAGITIAAGSETGPADGGDITLGTVEGRSVSISAFGTGADVGSVNLLGALRAATNLSLLGDGGITLGAIDIGGDLLVTMGEDVTVGSAVNAGGSINLQSTGPGGDVRVNAALTAGRSVTLGARDGDVVLGSFAVRAGAGSLSVTAGRNVLAAADSLLSTGTGGPSGGSISVTSGQARTRGGLGGDMRLGRVAGGDVNLQSYGSADGSLGDITLAGAVTARSLYVGSGSYSYANSAGDIRVLGALTASEEITLINFGAADLLIGPGAVVRADSDGNGDGSIRADIDGSVLADATSRLAVGSAEGAPTGDIFVVARGNFRENGYAGNGDIVLGAASARDIVLETYGDAQGRGLITLAGEVVTTDSLTVEAGQDGTSGLRVLGSIRSGGAVSLEASGAVEFGAGVLVESGTDTERGGALTVASETGAVTVGSGARLIGGSGLSVEAATLLTVAEGAVLEGRQRQGAVSAWPMVSLSAEDGGVFISAADIDLRGSIVSRLGQGFGDLVLLMQGDSATIGGDGSGGGFNLSNAEFQRLQARNLVAAAESGDITVQNLTLDSERLTDLWLGTGSEGRLTVAGTVNSTGPRRVNLRLGFVASVSDEDDEGERGPAGDAADRAPLPEGDRYIPGEIVITGSLGGGGRLGNVSMIAENDIIMGSAAYLAAAEGDEAFDPGREGNLATPGADHLFVQADGLQMAAGSRILQQNTGPRGSHTGVRIGRPTAEQPLIVRYDDLLSGESGAGSAGPQFVDLHLVIEGEGGTVITGRQAAEAAGLLAIGGPDREAALVINGCSDVGAIACSGDDDVPVFQNPIELELAATQATQSSEAVEGAIQTFLVVPTDESEDAQRDAIGLPVTGSGNEDLWPGSLREVEP